MWFKQFQLFRLVNPIQSSASDMAERLLPLEFKPCLPTIPSSTGWVSPVEEEGAPLARGVNGCIMLCMQIEEKILPASVVNQTLKDKVKEVEAHEVRKVRQKEKLSYKDEIVHTLLPRAFTKLTRIYAYIDTRYNWLLINTSSAAKAELFISLFEKTLADIPEPFDVIKPSAVLTHWLKDQGYPTEFAVEKSCVLQDPNQQHRVIRAQHQDLFVESIQSLLKDGCEVMQLALCWHDRIQFMMSDDFSFKNVKLAEDDILDIKDEAETREQRFDADFVLMTEMFSAWLNDLLPLFMKGAATTQKQRLALVGS